MASMTLWYFVFLVLAIALGYALGYWQQQNGSKPVKNLAERLPQAHYQKGLTYLLKDEPDAAIDTFIDALEVNDETLDIHLALGKMLRRRGELTRAVVIHQHCLSHPGLSTHQHHLVELELAADYFRSGLLDRAETILKELVGSAGVAKQTRSKALERLLQVYQAMGDWLEAIDIADQLTAAKFAASPDLWRQQQSQFSCELAQLAIAKNDEMAARRYLRNAQQYNPSNVRALLLLAQLEMDQEAYAEALAALVNIPEHDARYLPDMLVPMEQCYKAMGKNDEFVASINGLYRQYGGRYLLAYLCYLLIQSKNTEQLDPLLQSELALYSESSIIAELYPLVDPDQRSQAGALLAKYLMSSQRYVCSQCGFEGEQLHWLCPGCQSWATIAISY